MEEEEEEEANVGGGMGKSGVAVEVEGRDSLGKEMERCGVGGLKEVGESSSDEELETVTNVEEAEEEEEEDMEEDALILTSSLTSTECFARAMARARERL